MPSLSKIAFDWLQMSQRHFLLVATAEKLHIFAGSEIMKRSNGQEGGRVSAGLMNIVWTFPHCVFSNVFSKHLHKMVQSHIMLHLFDFSNGRWEGGRASAGGEINEYRFDREHGCSPFPSGSPALSYLPSSRTIICFLTHSPFFCVTRIHFYWSLRVFFWGYGVCT